MAVIAAATEAWAAVACAAVTFLLIGPVVAFAWLVIGRCIADPTSYDRAINDVEQFIDLTNQSRAQAAAAPRLPLFETSGADAASAAIGRALILKEAARRARWRPLAEERGERTMSESRESPIHHDGKLSLNLRRTGCT